jgi:hypothetical protein
MRNFRLLIVALATICVLALGVFGLVHRPSAPDLGDDIIIKGGSMTIQCGQNHGMSCLGTPDANGKYTHKKTSAHILHVTITDNTGAPPFDRVYDKDHQPTITINYK